MHERKGRRHSAYSPATSGPSRCACADVDASCDAAGHSCDPRRLLRETVQTSGWFDRHQQYKDKAKQNRSTNKHNKQQNKKQTAKHPKQENTARKQNKRNQTIANKQHAINKAHNKHQHISTQNKWHTIQKENAKQDKQTSTTQRA